MEERKHITQDLKKFIEFCEARELLHIDWFGKISWNQNDESNPLIHFYLSPLIKKNIGGKVKLLPDKSRQEQVALGIGYLPYLSIGNVFFKGKTAPKKFWPETDHIQFMLDTSDLNAVIDRKLNDQKEKGDYWVSHKVVEKMHWGDACESKYKTLQGACLSSKKGGKKQKPLDIDVVIHEIELITYYYARTTNLAKAAFSGHYTYENIERKIICTTRHQPTFDPKTETAYIIHQHGFVRNDMPTIGRILFTPKLLALQGAWQIGKSSMGSVLTNGNGIAYGYPTTIFPFEGSTTLTLEGRWLKQREGKWTFLANKIIDCTHPFPFKILEYRDAVDSRGERADENEAEKFTWHDNQQNAASREDGVSVSDERPSSVPSIFVDLPDRAQSALDRVKLIKLEPEKCTHRSPELNTTDDSRYCPNMSTGDASSGESSSQPTKIQNDIRINSPVSRNLEDFVKAVELIKERHPDWIIENLAIGTPHLVDDIIYSCFPKKRNKHSNSVMQFSFHDRMKTKVRRYICYEINYKNKFGYLFNGESRIRLSPDIEDGSTEHMSILFLRTTDFKKVNPSNFLTFIDKTVEGGAWPSQARLDNFIRCHTIYPGTKSCEDIAARISNLVKRSLEL